MNGGNTVVENRKTSLKDDFCVWSDAGKAEVESEIGEEYTLPDYLPDIRKILLVKAKTREGGFFTEEGKADVEGNVVFTVIYLGDNGEIKSVKRELPYENTVSMEGIYTDSVVDVDTYLKSRSVRALSPRKLSMKIKVVSSVSVKNKICVSPRLSGGTGVEDEFSLERKTDRVKNADYIRFTENDIRVSEDVEYKGKNPIGEIVAGDVDVFAGECRCSDGKLYLKGTAKVRCLILQSDESGEKFYDSVEKNIVVEHVSDVELPAGDWECRAVMEVTEFEIAPGNDGYGESRIIEADIVCRAVVTAVSNEDSVFTDDVFSTSYAYSNTVGKVETERLVKCSTANFSADGKGEFPKSDGESGERVIFSDADANVTLSAIEDGKMIFTGECEIKATAGSKNGFVNTDFTFPIRFETPSENVGEFRCVCKCDVLESKVKTDGSVIFANVEILLNYAVFEKVSVNTVTQISIDKSQPLKAADEKVMILYYPEKNETLWSVAKKYGVSRADLENANNRQMSDGLPRVILIPTSAR